MAKKKIRHYVRLQPPNRPYREAYLASYESAKTDDRSRHRVSEWTGGGAAVIAAMLGMLAGQGATIMVAEYVLHTDVYYVSGWWMALAVLVGAALFYLISVPARKWLRRRLLAGRPVEEDEIASAVDELAAIAKGEATVDPRAELFPIESVFRCLDHNDPVVRRFVADAIAQLPEHIRATGVSRYRKHLTSRQLCLLPGMEGMTPELAAAMGADRQPWPEEIRAWSAE